MTTRNDRDMDDLLSEDAGRIGTSYRKLGKIEPPRRLDRNVLAEASRAVHGRSRASRWLLGVGTAAGVLLAGGIAWRVNHDMLQQRESASMSSPAVDAGPAGVIRVEPHEKFTDSARSSDEPAPINNSSDASAAKTPRTAPPENSNLLERRAAQTKQKLDKVFVPYPAVKKLAPEPSRSSASSAQELREQTTTVTAAGRKSTARQPRTVESGHTTFPRPPIEGQTGIPRPPDVSRPAPASTGDESMPAEIQNSAAPAPAPMQKAESAPENAADRASAPERDDVRRERFWNSTNPAVTVEIDRIRALLLAGRRDAAIEALRQLRRQHPDLVLPADLSALDG